MIVDKKNKIIGAKERSEVNHDVDIYRSTGVWITNSKGEVLIAQRKFSKVSSPGKWGPAAAGTVDEGETYKQNAYKELEEELGLSGVELSEGPKQYVGKPMRQFAQWYIGRTDIELKDLKLQETEVEAARWIKIDELIEDIEKRPEQYIPKIAASMKFLGY